MKKEIINPDTVYKPVGPIAHSQAIKVGDTVYISGQVSADKDGNVIGVGDIDTQIKQTFENFRRVLEAVGASFANVVKVTHYSTNFEHCRKLREARTKYLGEGIASTGVIVKNLGSLEKEFLVEIDAIAVID